MPSRRSLTSLDPSGRYVLDQEQSAIVRRSRPSVQLLVEPGLVLTEARRLTMPTQCIFLDGVYDGPPMLDNARRHYALDHHRGVVRSFTLATCEQAAVVIAGGLPLDEGGWRLYVNQPDLDALLAAWVLLNDDRLLADGMRLLWSVMPLIRVEGVIDVHGLDMGVVSGLRPRQYAAHESRLTAIREREVEARKRPSWRTGPLLSFAFEQLNALDRALLGRMSKVTDPPSAPASVRSVSWPMERIAVLYEGEEGIYEVEQELKAVHGRSLAVIVLHRGDGHFTLLQVDPFLPTSLADIYPVLNDRDPRADVEAGNGWGGSADIGGSPRASGTGLDAEGVLALVAEQFAVAARRRASS